MGFNVTISRIYDVPTLTPVNKDAGRSIGGGFEYTPNKQITQRHFQAPPRMRPIPRAARGNPGFLDLTGVCFGRFVVLGLLAEDTKQTLWVVRCSCGDYETRRSKSIRNPRNTTDCCEYCRHLLHLKKQGEFRRTSKYSSSR
jgi:hypothetical protein